MNPVLSGFRALFFQDGHVGLRRSQRLGRALRHGGGHDGHALHRALGGRRRRMATSDIPQYGRQVTPPKFIIWGPQLETT